jgi:hypothetical protein
MGNIWESGNSLWRKEAYIVDLVETLGGRGPLLGLYNRNIYIWGWPKHIMHTFKSYWAYKIEIAIYS